MEFFLFSFILNNKNKKKKTKQILHIIFIIINIILEYNSISTEIKLISNPYLTIQEYIDNTKLRNLPEQNIYGSSFKLNYFYTNLYFGEKMQKQGLILDTGSCTTTSTCSPLCQSCGNHIRPPYDIKSNKKIISCLDEKCKMVPSKCNSNSNCSFSISYSEGSSLNGIFINEIIRFGENYTKQKGKNIPIGCTIQETHLFYKQEVNGIMGLCNNDYNFVNILYKLGAIQRNIFCLCYAQLGGIFTIGEINYNLHKENITFFPMLKDRDKYFGLDVKSIFVNNKKVGNFTHGENNIFIDSGTTISYFNKNVSEEIIHIMEEECKKFNKKEACGNFKYDSIFGYCYYFNNTNDLNYAVKNYWPTIHFNLEGYDYRWTPENYVFNLTNDTIIGACMGFNYNYGKKFTFGASWIIGHDIIFDRENQLLGIAEANCYKNQKINLTNGLELDIDNNYYKKNSNNNLKNIISLLVIIFANILLTLMIIFIIVIIFKKNNQVNIAKEIQLKIKEHNSEYILNEKNKNRDSSYIKVLDESIRGNKTQISLS